MVVAALTLGFLSVHGANHPRSLPLAYPRPIVIQVQGDVPHPDVHVLPGPIATMRDALRAAGASLSSGSTFVPDAVLTTVISPGTLVHVEQGADGVKPTTEPMPAVPRLLIGMKLDLNEASEEDLMQIPRMKRETAHAIVERRKESPWRDLNDLAELPGVGARTVDRWRSALSVEVE